MRHRISLVLIVFIVSLFFATHAMAQTTLPDTPTTDSALVDPNSSDFSSDIFNTNDNANTNSNAATVDTTTNTSTDTTTDTTTTETTPTTTVADTQTGPATTIVFWLAFLVSFAGLYVIRSWWRKREVYDRF